MALTSTSDTVGVSANESNGKAPDIIKAAVTLLGEIVVKRLVISLDTEREAS